MTTLNINGKRVKVDDQFLQLSPEQQQATVEQIAAQIGQQEPPQGGDIFDSLGQGAMFGFSDEIAGAVGATVMSGLNLIGKGTGEDWKTEYIAQRDMARKDAGEFAERNPKTALAAEVGGGLLTGGVGAARAGAFQGANKIRNLAAIGAAEGGLYGAGTSEAESLGGMALDTGKGAALGAVTGTVLPAAGRYVGGKLRSAGNRVSRDPLEEVIDSSVPTNRYADDVAILRDHGVSLTTGQRTGSSGLKSLETTVDKTIVGGAVDKVFRRQREQFQSRLMKMAGFPDDVAKEGKITDDAIDAARDAFTKKYNAALNGKSVNLGSDEFLDVLSDVESRHSRLLTAQQKREVSTLISDFLDEATKGPLSGDQYQSMRSFINKRAKQFKQSRPEMSELYSDLRGALDDAFVSSTGSTNKDLNRSYAHFKQLETLWRRNGGVHVAQGELPLASLNRLAKNSPGSKDWRRFVNAGAAVLGDATPNSGTASRMANLAMGGGAVVGGVDAGIISAGIPFLTNQAMARGVGSGASRPIGNALRRGGNRAEMAANLIGTTGGVTGGAVLDDKKNKMLAASIR